MSTGSEYNAVYDEKPWFDETSKSVTSTNNQIYVPRVNIPNESNSAQKSFYSSLRTL